ncbi:putative lipopolysaccharide heptosyltransferase III [Mixta tenebrionis]|uniref:Lipopolysaccharide heptosyltransferase 3 n=1 Tax=Mixta tenebrionis TaxID=2562439 RepID=A0A506V545_9GAMM|nr:putative lipopolysaccharide heptosyltransferase III [Mixta tenebrionis]TPW40549.1 putative lipopolysaccharide heptosyltransferase III [Mixta tenebrionis]
MATIPASFTPRTILVIKLRHHGDMLLTTPVINALRQRYPDASIDVLLYQETSPMLQAHPAIRHLHRIDRKWKKLGAWQQLKHELALVNAIRRSRYDLVINLADQWRSALITLISGAQERIGFAYNKRDNAFWRLCHNQLVAATSFNQLHTVEQNLLALSPLGIPTNHVPVSMHYAHQEWLATEQLLLQRGVNGPYVVIQPTSRWVFKCWDDEKMAALIDRLNQPDLKIVLTAAPDAKEMAMIEHILSLCRNPQVTTIAGQLSLTQLAALIDHARLFIGVDSAPMHMAAALQTPCVALFGPTKLQHWRPWGENNRVIWAGDYGPLPAPDSIDTQTERRYLSAIPVDDVVAAARSYLDA